MPDFETPLLQPGEAFNELYMIQEGIVVVQFPQSMVKCKPPLTSRECEFLTLPTFSYFGDYQILFELRSQYTFRCVQVKSLLMCLKKSKFKQLMDDFPDARRFYYERAYKRRIEFRRRCFKQVARAKLKRGIPLYNSQAANDEAKDQGDSVSSHQSYISTDSEGEKDKHEDDEFNDEDEDNEFLSDESDSEIKKRRERKEAKFMERYFV